MAKKTIENKQTPTENTSKNEGKDSSVNQEQTKALTASLEEFILIWNEIQELSFPTHHKTIANWLSERFNAKNKNGLLMAFRNSGKSTLVGLFCAWVLFRNPSLRILIMAADFELAKKMVRNIKRIIEKHPLTSELRPKSKDQWASDRFTVNRTVEFRDPSVLARGLGGNVTGSRADIIICDDVEVPNNCDTPAKREELRARLADLDFVLVPGGMSLYIGTPHTFYTIYRTENDEEECKAFLYGFPYLKIPLLDKKGESAWPERFPLEKIASLRKRAGPNRFASQMLLTPVNIAEGRLDVNRLRIYEGELEYREVAGRGVLNIGGKAMISVSAWWDPSYGKNGDNSVIACVFCDEEGNRYLHEIKYIKVLDEIDDSASNQARQVADFIERNYLPSLYLETNGIGKFLPAILRKELKSRLINCAVIEISSSRGKDLRIIEAFDAVLANRALYIHKSVQDTPFMAEMREWTPDGKSHDDGIDAVAGCLLNEPLRTGKLPAFRAYSFADRPDWRGFNGSYKALSDFKV